MPTSTGIPISTIKNVTDNTLKAYERSGRWVSLFPDLTKYVGWMLFESNKFKKDVSGNMPYQWQVQVDGIDNTQHIGAYSQIALGDNSISATAQVASRNTETHFVIDMLERRAQAGGKALVDLVEQKFNAMMESHIKTMEAAIWGCPAESDSLTPYGIATFVVMYDSTDATPTTGDFLGTFPYGGGAEWTTAPNGLSPTTYTRAGNWAAKYTSVSYDDLIEKMSTGADKTNFQAPNAFAQLVKDMPEDSFDRAVYMPYTPYRGFVKLARSQDGDNKSGDVAYYDSMPKFRGRKVIYVPHLDTVTGAPVYMLNHNSIPFLKDPAHQGQPITNGLERVSVEQPTTMAKVYLWTWTTCGIDRRLNAVFSTTNKQGT